MGKLNFRWVRLLMLIIVFLPVHHLELSAQNSPAWIKGKVLDENKKPIVGVTVVDKSTNKGTSTNTDGGFRLPATKSTTTLSFSYIGYADQSIDISGKDDLVVIMKENAQVVDEVVVVGYGTAKKETMTGAIAQVKASDVLKSPVANMGQAITGRAAGVTTYQYSGEPGADNVVIRIRGVGTLNSANPLILVDGVERDFTQIDPNEIESFSILKDAASTAVFGIRGANGVIIITTKSGQEGPARVSFTANFAGQQPTRMPNSTDAATFARIYDQAIHNDDPTLPPLFGPQKYELYRNGSDPLGHPNTNWSDYMLKKMSLQQQYNLSVSGGTKSTKYYTSIGLFDQGGLMNDFSGKVAKMTYPTTYDYKRVNIRSNIDVNLTSTTKIGVKLGGIIQTKVAPPDQFATILTYPALGGPIIYDGKLVLYSDLGLIGRNSPLESLFDSQRNENANTINTSLTLNQTLDFITKGLLFRGLASYDSYYKHTISKSQAKIFYLLVDGYDADGNPVKVLQQPYESSTVVPTPTESWGRNQKMHAEAALEYKRTFSGHSVSGLVLGTLDKKWWPVQSNGSAYQYQYIPISYMGIVGRFTYDYKSKYLFEFNAGYNGSENFPEGKRFAWFPAVSIGWNVAEEKFIKDNISQDILSQLKLRASYGVTGNDDTGGRRFMYLSGEYTSGGGGYFGSSTQTQLPGFIEGKLGNKDISWETASKQNYGIDLGLFNSKLTLTAEYFKDKRVNILATRMTEPIHMAISGQDVYNIGEVHNEGFEIEARWNQRFNDFSYSFGGNFSYSHNNIVEDGSIRDPKNPQLWRVGNPVGTPFGYVFDGFFNSMEEVRQGPVYGSASPGDVRYVDINGDGIISELDQMPLGYPEMPEINYGFSGSAKYKGFDFSFMFQGAAHSTKVLSGDIYRTPLRTSTGIPSFAVNEFWSEDNIANAKRPKPTLAFVSNSYENSSLWTRDGSYLKLRNVEIAYTFSQSGLKKAFKFANLASVRFYTNGQNLFIWDKLKYVDPEARTGTFNYPQLRVINIGMQITF